MQHDLAGMPRVGDSLRTQRIGACALEVSTCIAILQHEEPPVKGIIHRPIANANAQLSCCRCNVPAALEDTNGAMPVLPFPAPIIKAIGPHAILHNCQQ